MDELLINAGLYHDQAERMYALAMKEKNRKRQQVMFAIAEHYYLLHDEFMELGRLPPPPALRLAEGPA
ncbi:MAG TPA: hypothetical protein VFA87_11130 [Rhizomicrobium sp.]|jgi:hypothetical protein|nr:hypothetical protein [Rhizomicrobium sp.]